MRTPNKPNAWVIHPVDDNDIYKNRITLPTGAVREAGMNTDHDIFIIQEGERSLRLTQDGSIPSDEIIGTTKLYKGQGAIEVHLGSRISNTSRVLVDVIGNEIRLTGVGAW